MMLLLEIVFVAVNAAGLLAGVWSVHDTLSDLRTLPLEPEGRMVVRAHLRATLLRSLQFFLLLIFAFVVIFDAPGRLREFILIATLMLVSGLMATSSVLDVLHKRRLLEEIERRMS